MHADNFTYEMRFVKVSPITFLFWKIYWFLDSLDIIKYKSILIRHDSNKTQIKCATVQVIFGRNLFTVYQVMHEDKKEVQILNSIQFVECTLTCIHREAL